METRVVILAAAPWQINPKDPKKMYGYYKVIEKPPKPKCLLHHNGIVLLRNQVFKLNLIGIHDIKIIVNYKKEQIKQYIKQNNLKIDIIYNPDWEDPVKSFEMGAEGAEGDVIFLLGDVWITDYAVKLLQGSKKNYTGLFSPNVEGEMIGYEHAIKVKKGYIKNFFNTYREMFTEDVQLYNFKDVILKLDPKPLIDPDVKDFDIYEATEDYFMELQAQLDAKNRFGRGAVIDSNTKFGKNIVIGENSVIGTTTVKGKYPIEIGDNVQIKALVVIERGIERPTIIGNGSIIDHGCVIKAGVQLPPNSRIPCGVTIQRKRKKE